MEFLLCKKNNEKSIVWCLKQAFMNLELTAVKSSERASKVVNKPWNSESINMTHRHTIYCCVRDFYSTLEENSHEKFPQLTFLHARGNSNASTLYNKSVHWLRRRDFVAASKVLNSKTLSNLHKMINCRNSISDCITQRPLKGWQLLRCLWIRILFDYTATAVDWIWICGYVQIGARHFLQLFEITFQYFHNRFALQKRAE